MSIFSILVQRKRDTQVGEVIKPVGGSKYVVRVGRRERTIRNAMASALGIGSRVVVADTERGTFIVGFAKGEARRTTEVIING